ncbi:RNA-binding protein [uncultured Chitinophaga sp.]|uniref:RNA recognition motif domain-containing protein n=1 Tax=uncultured Chitinophaga sp. TaxID=339340 RepID=UPI0025D6E9C0|nr:RNA-binding protein [uncultured Chitinophaga sp.]
MNIYVANLAFSVDSQALRQHFSQYGEITSANVITDKFTGQSRGFAFLEMPNDAEAQKAIDELNGSMLGNRSIVVNEAKPKKERFDNNNNRGGRW